MAMKEFCVWKGLILVLFLFAVDGQTSGPSFLVTFSAVIESCSDAKLCASLLKPNESLTMTIFLVDDKNLTTLLVQQTSSTAFHRCFSFQAPEVDRELVQKLRVVLQGRFFKMTEERKVMFRRYLPLTFIQTDKPIYNPGQTVNFRAVTMDPKFVPLDQMVKPDLLVFWDLLNNQIGQWTNVSSTGWILELSHQLNPEAQVGMYTLRAFIDDRMISRVFEVKKYVLPKFDVILTAPTTYSVADVGLKVEACAKYTYGQPVPGQALVEVCRELFPYIVVPGLSRVCLIKTLNITGCASLTISMSEFFGTKFEDDLRNEFLVNVNVTEEGTDVMMSKSTTVYITFQVGMVSFLDLPEFFNYGSVMNGKISASYFNGTPIARKAVYLLDVFSLEGSNTVTVQSSSVAGELYNFNVNRDNRLLYQEKPLKNVPGRYSVRAKGSTCVSVQVACFYNIPTPIKASRTLSVEVKVARDCKVRGADLMLNVTVKYNGAKPTTNMVIVNIKLLSGFTADTALIGSPPDSFAPLVQRVDSGNDHVLVYLKEVPKGIPMTYRLQLKPVLAVQNFKPAVVEVYDYYQPSDVFETTYMPPCP
uniref:Alpha-2-macroglobulin-like protein 1 n=1 Tax=Sinocyclocheilus grahami TaxID=75366 RepID=A0A672NQ86_SINGR